MALPDWSPPGGALARRESRSLSAPMPTRLLCRRTHGPIQQRAAEPGPAVAQISDVLAGGSTPAAWPGGPLPTFTAADVLDGGGQSSGRPDGGSELGEGATTILTSSDRAGDPGDPVLPVPVNDGRRCPRRRSARRGSCGSIPSHPVARRNEYVTSLLDPDGDRRAILRSRSRRRCTPSRISRSGASRSPPIAPTRTWACATRASPRC